MAAPQVATSTTRITKQAKLARLGASIAIKMAKDNNDPLYRKYKKFKDKWKEYRLRIVRKYRNKARGQLGINFNLNYLK